MKEYIKEIRNILMEFNIKNGEDYLNKEEDELAVIYENLKIVQEEYGLSDEEMEDILDSLLSQI